MRNYFRAESIQVLGISKALIKKKKLFKLTGVKMASPRHIVLNSQCNASRLNWMFYEKPGRKETLDQFAIVKPSWRAFSETVLSPSLCAPIHSTLCSINTVLSLTIIYCSFQFEVMLKFRSISTIKQWMTSNKVITFSIFYFFLLF